MEFWRQQGVTPEMVEANIKKMARPEEMFLQDMKHYSFKAEAGHFKNKTIPDHMAYFIGGIKEFKGWNKPDGYISHEERQEIDLRALLEEKKKQSERIESLKRELAFEDWYFKYQENPESEEVKAVTDQANSFEKKQLREKPDKKKWLRTIWEKVQI